MNNLFDKKTARQYQQMRREAEKRRGEYCYMIAQRKISLLEAIENAAGDKTLEKISLKRLYMADGMKERGARRRVEMLRERLVNPPKRLNIAWLLADTGNFAMFIDRFVKRKNTPWEGFPYSQPPIEIPSNSFIEKISFSTIPVPIPREVAKARFSSLSGGEE